VPDYDKLYNAIQRAEETSYGGDEGQLAEDRAAAIDAYLGRNTMPAPDGRSQIVDRTVYETIQWMLPSLARIFANGDDVVELPPLGRDDEKTAKQEAQYLNYLVLQKNNWFELFTTGAKDALLTKAGYLYAYRENRRQVELESYKRQTQEGVALIMQDKPEVLSIEEYPDEDYVEPPPQPIMQMGPEGPVPVMDPMTGQPAMAPPPPPPMLYDLEIRRVKEEVAYCIDVLPPERCRVSEKHKQVQLIGCPYFEYFDFVSISDLRRDGYKIEDDVGQADDPYESQEDTARDQYYENASERNELDPSMRRVKTRYVWIAHDYDEDGIAELNYVIVVGRKIVHREECNEIPVGVLCPDPLPHRHVGLCPADNTLDIQAIKTVTIRNGLDNLQISNNPVKFGDPTKVNLDDMLTSRPGGITRTRNGAIFGQDFGVYPIPFVFPQVIEAMGYFEQMTEGRTGVNRYFQGTDQNALNKTAMGIQQLSTMAAARVEQIARHFANGIERLFAVLHALVLKGGHRTDTVKLRGEWVEIDPATWRRRTDFRISVGYASGNKDAQVNRLMMLAAQQLQAMQMGIPVVQPRNYYETMIELTKATDMAAPERMWTDPSTVPPPQPPQPDPTIVAVEQMKVQSAERLKAAEIQSTEKVKGAELDMDKYKVDTDATVKLTLAQQQSTHAERLESVRGHVQAGLKQIEGKQAADLKSHEMQLKSQPVLEHASQVQALSKQLVETAQSMKEALQIILTAKRTIRRGKDGKAEGVDITAPDGTVIAQQKIQRGPDGRVLGSA
jgi:hypothetical protein